VQPNAGVRHLPIVQTIVGSGPCPQRQGVTIERARALADAARLLARTLAGEGPFVSWAAVAPPLRDEVEAALGELRAALADADLTLSEIMSRGR
jgi:hypothetical protein